MRHKFLNLILPLIVGLTLSLVFYFPYVKSHRVPVPLDIITGMYLPWLDQRREIFPNGGPVKNPLPSDVVSLTLPLRFHAIELIKQGYWPLWNSKILSGTPLLANFQSAIFNPLNILFFTGINFIDVWSIQVILQSFLAFVFFYLFISHYQQHKLSALLGSFIWAFNGFFSLWFQYNTVVYAAIFLPLALYSITKLSNNILWGFLLTLSLVLSVFSGNPPITMIVYGAVVIYIIIFHFTSPKKVFISFLFLFLSLGFAAPQLFIGLTSSNRSIRQDDNVAITANIKYLMPIKLLSIAVPDFFGNPSTRNTWQNFPLYDNSTIYNGIFPIILFLLSFTIKISPHQKKLYYYCLIISAITLIIMMPTFISKFIGSLNFMGLSSMVFTRFSLLWSFSLATISSIMFSKLINKQLNYYLILKISLFLFIFIITPATMSYLTLRYFKTIINIDSNWILQTTVAVRNTLYPILILSTIFVSISAFYKFSNKILKYIALFTLLLVIFFDFYRFFTKYNSFTTLDNFYPKSELTDYLQKNSFRFARESSQLIPSNMWMMYSNLQTPSGYDTTYSKEYGQFISLINSNRISGTTNRYLEIDQFDSPLTNLLSIDHVIATKTNQFGLSDNGTVNPDFEIPKYQKIKDFGRYILYKNNESLPFIRSVDELVYSKNLEQTQELLTQKNYKSIAIVNQEISPKGKLDQNIIINDIKIQSQEINFSTLSSNSTTPSFIVISENYDPGWQLLIDGHSQQILRTNHTFMGFYLPPQNHHVSLRYQPPIFFLSLKIAIISLFISVIFTIYIKLWNQNRH